MESKNSYHAGEEQRKFSENQKITFPDNSGSGESRERQKHENEREKAL